MAVYQLKWLP